MLDLAIDIFFAIVAIVAIASIADSCIKARRKFLSMMEDEQ